MKTILNSLIDLFFPMRCIHCNNVISRSQVLCVPCIGNLSYTHWNMDQKNKVYTQLQQYCNVESAYSLLHFTKENSTQAILHEIKYKNRPELGIEIAKLITIDLSYFDGIIPIPIHPKRLKQRGYNQVEAFAKQLATQNNINYIDHILYRKTFNSSQVFKSKRDRIHDLKNAFALKDFDLKGHYLIIDDLVTTGATLSQAIVLFNQSENIKISVLTIACA